MSQRAKVQQRTPKLIARRNVLLASATALGMGGCAADSTWLRSRSMVPLLPVKETQRTVLGRRLRYLYGWVDEVAQDDPVIVDFLRAHRDHETQVMAPLQPLVQTLLRRAATRDTARASAPAVQHGAWRYRVGAMPSGAWALFRRALETDDERLVLSADSQADVTIWGTNDDGRWIAYAVRTGPEDGLMRVRDVAGGQDLPDRVDRAWVNIDLTHIVWARDGSGFFFSEANAAGRPWRALFHRLGAVPSSDTGRAGPAD